MYDPDDEAAGRNPFTVAAVTRIIRPYHATVCVMVDGRIVVSGSDVSTPTQLIGVSR